MRHSTAFIDTDYVDLFVLFSADLYAEKDILKALILSDFSLIYIYRHSYSIIRYSVFNNYYLATATSLPLPRYRYLAIATKLSSFIYIRLSVF